MLQILLQQHQLRHHGALFEEHFYGLERAGVSVSRRRRIIRSLIFSVIAPYAKAKMDKVFERAREAEADGVSLTRSRAALLVTYPYLHFIYEASVLLYYFAYALEKVPSKPGNSWSLNTERDPALSGKSSRSLDSTSRGLPETCHAAL